VVPRAAVEMGKERQRAEANARSAASAASRWRLLCALSPVRVGWRSAFLWACGLEWAVWPIPHARRAGSLVELKLEFPFFKIKFKFKLALYFACTLSH
jgi:hypothetical protein